MKKTKAVPRKTLENGFLKLLQKLTLIDIAKKIFKNK
jgi:hypothetical protein